MKDSPRPHFDSPQFEKIGLVFADSSRVEPEKTATRPGKTPSKHGPPREPASPGHTYSEGFDVIFRNAQKSESKTSLLSPRLLPFPLSSLLHPGSFQGCFDNAALGRKRQSVKCIYLSATKNKKTYLCYENSSNRWK